MALPDTPLTRAEEYLNNIATGEGTIPDVPYTRIEQYLDYIAKNGSGSVDPEDIASTVTNWLEENVDPVGSAVVVDSSLSIEGAAADAKETGDGIRSVQSDVNALKGKMLLDLSDVRNAYVNGHVGDTISFPSTNASRTIVNIISVISGQKYRISVTYGAEIMSSNSRPSACVDSDDIITQLLSVPTVANSTQTIEFTAVSGGFLCLTIDAKYIDLSIVGADPNIAETTQKKIDAVNEQIDELENIVSNSKAKASLIACLRNMGWIVVDSGESLLTSFCEQIGVDGWVDVKPNTSISGSTGNASPDNANRQATGFVDVDGFASFSSAFEDADGYNIYYAVRCYDENKAFLGSAKDSNQNTGSQSGSVSRYFLSGTKYIRLLLTPNTSVEPSLDLNGVYTGRVLNASFSDGNNTVTTRKFAFVEVDEFV